MGLNYPTLDELMEQARAELQTQLPGIDPTIGGSWARAFVDGSAVMALVTTYLVRDLEQQLFPQTSTGEFLDIWGGYEGLERLAASAASGYCTLEGVAGTNIPAATEFLGSNGYTYVTQTDTNIATVSQNIQSIQRSGSVATCTCLNAHHLATGVTLTISGADQAEYNVTAQVVVVSDTQYQYDVSGSPATPATGATIQHTGVFASIPVEANTTGGDTGMLSGGQISNETYGTAVIQYDGLSGGSSTETDSTYRQRILLSRSSISGVFTPDQVKLAAMSVSGNTRVFVKKPEFGATGGYADPGPGQVSVFVLRDDGAFTQTLIDKTKQVIIDDGSMPAEMAEDDLFVQAPTGVPVNFSFTSLSPDTSTMRSAIQAQLEAYFNDTVDFEQTITTTEYLCAIQSTMSISTGEYIKSFSLSSPSGDIAVGSGEIAILGSVSYG